MIKLNITLPVAAGEEQERIKQAVISKLRVKVDEIRILKKSLDARNKQRLCFIYSVAVSTSQTDRAIKNGGESYEPDRNDLESIIGDKKYVGARPIVIGAGPCGLFAALTLAKLGARPVVLERGDCVEERKKKINTFATEHILDPDSNVQFGEGGAGTFSDGKLNTGINSLYVPTVLHELVKSGAPNEITYLNKPHVGTDKLEETVKGLRRRITEAGGEILFRTKVTDFFIKDNAICGVRTDKGDFFSDRVYLCVGHSARDIFYTLYAKGVVMAPKIFSMGVRIEHLQEDIDYAQYGRGRGEILPPADYKTAVKLSDNNSLYSFCMCPGGTVINAASEEGGLCVNGMSNYARDGKNANSALLINVGEKECGEGVMAGVEQQRLLERLAYRITGGYRAPVQTYGGFLSGKITEIGRVMPSVTTGYSLVDLNAVLPSYIAQGLKEGIPLIAKRIKGFDAPDAVLTGVETRSSSPVRICRDEKCRSSVEGLYPLGEGAGYAGGITSAAADGIRGVMSSLA